MVTATHSKVDHHPLLEATLWLIWLAARATLPAISTILRAVLITPGRAVAAALRRAAHAATAPLRAGYRHGAAAIHRAALRLTLALSGPSRDTLTGTLTVAGTKLRHRAGILLVAGLMLANLLWLALR